jgi:hypothetical protein
MQVAPFFGGPRHGDETAFPDNKLPHMVVVPEQGGSDRTLRNVTYELKHIEVRWAPWSCTFQLQAYFVEGMDAEAFVKDHFEEMIHKMQVSGGVA